MYQPWVAATEIDPPVMAIQNDLADSWQRSDLVWRDLFAVSERASGAELDSSFPDASLPIIPKAQLVARSTDDDLMPAFENTTDSGE
jgi:hypothetical protein